jgi:hypothetical protein
MESGTIPAATVAGLGRVEIGEGRRRRLADHRGSRAAGEADDGGIRLGPPPRIDRRAALGRQVGGVDDVLHPEGDAAQRALTGDPRRMIDGDEGADGVVLRLDLVPRQADRGFRRQRARIHAVQEIEKRQHRGPRAQGRGRVLAC